MTNKSINLLNISQVFESIQGEGHDIGKPCVFIRTHGCNLNCKWCDTKYSKDNNYLNIIDVYKLYKNISITLNTIYPNIDKIVITGGEPFYQSNTIDLIGYLVTNKRIKNIQIETNGLLLEDNQFLNLNDHKIHLTVSPKLDENFEKRLNIYNSLLTNLYAQNISFDLKFVYSKEKRNNIDKFIIKNRKYLPDEIYIMPLTVEEDYAATKRNALDAVNYCKEMGFIFTPRIQQELFKNNLNESTN